MLRGAEAIGELGRGEIVAIIGAVGVVEIGEEAIEPGLVAHRQNHVELHELIGGKMSEQPCLPVAGYFAHVARHQCLRAGL